MDTTRKLVEIFNKHNPKAHFISASAIGVYPNNERCDESLVIDYQKYDNFSQELTRNWERVANTYTGDLTITRFGVVLSSSGGAFPQMLKPFLFGIGGRIGTGQQYFSWIALMDLLNALDGIIEKREIGIYNLTAPMPLVNIELSKLIATVWHRPNLFPLPEFMVDLIFGQMGNELFCNSLQVIPARLVNEGFKFIYPNFLECIQAIHDNEI